MSQIPQAIAAMLSHARQYIWAAWFMWRFRGLDLPAKKRLIAYKFAILKVQAVALVTDAEAARLVAQYGLDAWRKLSGLE